jgi:hypothetical protein
VIVANKAGLQRVLTDYLGYYLRSRTHLALDKDTPFSRSVAPPSAGRVVATPQVGGLHQPLRPRRRIAGQSRSAHPQACGTGVQAGVVAPEDLLQRESSSPANLGGASKNGLSRVEACGPAPHLSGSTFW